MALEFSTGGPPAPTVRLLSVAAGRFVAELSDGTFADWGAAPVESDTGATVAGLVAAREAHATELARHEADLEALDGRADADEAAIADLQAKAAAAVSAIARIDGSIAALKVRADANDVGDAALTARVAALEARANASTTFAPGLTTTTTGF